MSDLDLTMVYQQSAHRTAAAINLERVVSGFFVILAATLNFGFVYGEIASTRLDFSWAFVATVLANILAAAIKVRDRDTLSYVQLVASMVALVQILVAAVVWVFGATGFAEVTSSSYEAEVVSLATGALLANFVSVTTLVIETAIRKR